MQWHDKTIERSVDKDTVACKKTINTKAHMMKKIKVMGLAAVAMLAIPAISSAQNVAVWLDGNLSDGGNPIVQDVNSLGFTATLVTTAQLDTPGFLNGFSALVQSRYDSYFGSYLDATAAANVTAYVGAAGSAGQGAVALLSNDASDNLANSSSGDPFDANINALFDNAVKFAVVSGHGFVGEFNGAVQAMAANTAGVPAEDLLTGTASPVGGYGPEFTYGVGPAGAGHPIDAGVTFPFTDSDNTTFLTTITGANPDEIVDIYTSQGIDGVPAVLANVAAQNGGHAPDAGSTMLLMSLSLGGIAAMRRRFAK
jgi:hypothetical protein